MFRKSHNNTLATHSNNAQVFAIMGLYYPERLAKGVIINAPSWFQIPWVRGLKSQNFKVNDTRVQSRAACSRRESQARFST